MRISLLTLIILASIILLLVKASDILDNYGVFVDISIVPSAYAQEEGGSADDVQKDEGKDDVQKEGGEQGEKPKPPVIPPSQYTPTELDILQRLSSRRDELMSWEKELEIKESILKITQEKIDYKISELRKLKQEVGIILEQYNAKESKKIKSLVKIYENMKPKAAAKIFSQLDINTMLSVAEKMKEDRLALILAKMDPLLAKELTVTFAKSGKLIPPKQEVK